MQKALSTRSRAPPLESAWTPLQTLPATAFSYTDRTISIGVEYEYRVLAFAHEPREGPRGPAHDFTAHGIISAGIEVPLVEQRGRAILMIDQTLGSRGPRVISPSAPSGNTVSAHARRASVCWRGGDTVTFWIARRGEVRRPPASRRP